MTATRAGTPWRLVHLEKTDSFLQFRRRETYLKTSAGRRWLKKILGKLDEASGLSGSSAQRISKDGSATAPR